MIQIIDSNTVKLTNSGVTIHKAKFDALNAMMVDGWYGIALKFVQVAIDAYESMGKSHHTVDDFNTDHIDLYTSFHYNTMIHTHIESLVTASVYTTMRDAIADSIGYANLSGIATLAWEMEYDTIDEKFYHDMLECAYWID